MNYRQERSADEAIEINDPTSSTDLGVKVITFNTWLIPFIIEPPFLDCGVKSRARRVANFLKASHNDVDIMLLQEVWSPASRVSTLSCLNFLFCGALIGQSHIEDALPDFFISREPNALVCGGVMKFIDSGLITASKFPIRKKKFVQYTAHADEDMLANKGALFTYTNDIIVVNTHLNAKQHHQECRKEQIEELLMTLEEFIRECDDEGLSTDKIIAGGDWNIDGIAEDAAEYEHIAARMETCGLKDIWKGSKVWDQNRRDLSHYLEIGATNFHDPETPAIPQRLDMIFTNGHVKSVKPVWKRFQTNEHLPKLYVPEDEERISDHAPLRAEISFPPPTSTSAI